MVDLPVVPEISEDTFWTNLYEPPETVVALHRDHGTSEQFCSPPGSLSARGMIS